MIIAMQDMLAVHDVTSGAVLWQRKPKEDYEVAQIDHLFITSQVAGCRREILYGTDKIDIYDVNTGEFIGSQKKRVLIMFEKVIATGPFICYPENGLDIHVIKIVDNKMKNFVFPFPVSKLAENGTESLRLRWMDIIGRSHVLVGQVANWKFENILLFTLDLDAAVSARNEREVMDAFSLPFGSVRTYTYEPVYETDFASGNIDMVGVMRTTEATTEVHTIESHFFVTKMQLPGASSKTN